MRACSRSRRVAALVTGLVSGIAPALQGSSPALSTVLSESARGGGTSRGRRRARAVLVVAEVALAVVLLVGAALFIGSFINVMRIDPGFRAEGVLAAQVLQRASPGSAQADIRPALADIVDRARQLPGVIDAAAAAPGIPFRINLQIGALQAPGQPLDYNKTVSVKVVTAGYHRTLAIPLRSGRYFTDDDREGAEAVVILSDAAARMFFGGDDPLGRVVIVVGDGERRVVGVVANARQASLEVSPHPEVYLPLAQGPASRTASSSCTRAAIRTTRSRRSEPSSRRCCRRCRCGTWPAWRISWRRRPLSGG